MISKRRYLVFTPIDPIYKKRETMVALKEHLARHVPDCDFILAYEDKVPIPGRVPNRFMALPMQGGAQQGTGSKADMVEVVANVEKQPDPDIIEALNIFDPRRPAPKLQ